MIRVLFDAHFLATPYSGNGRYTRGLLEAMQARSRVSKEYEITAYGPALPDDQVVEDYRIVKGRTLGRVLWEAKKAAKGQDIHVHHSQYTIPVTGHFKRCLTIHDAAFARRELSDYSRAKMVAFKYFATKADAIITVSQAAKDDLERVLPNSCPPIHVVYDGCALSASTPVERDLVQRTLLGFDRPYILYVGRMSKRKRVPLLIEAYFEFKRKHDGTLLLVGELDDDMPRVSTLLQGRRDIVWFRGVSEAVKTAVLETSDVFVYLSEYEGFGLPVAEAMLARLPVVIPNTPALVEVTRGTAVQVESDPVSVSEGIIAAVFGTRRNTLDLASQIASGYSWDSTAAQTMEIYRTLTAADPSWVERHPHVHRVEGHERRGAGTDQEPKG